MEQLITELEKAKAQYECDEMKIYYENPQSYCVKFIKNGVIVARIKRGHTAGGTDRPNPLYKNTWGKKTL